MRRSRTWFLIGAAAVAVAALVGCSSGDRQAEVAERGAQVMPFDLERTTHRFTPTADGLVEEVVADRSDDAEQVELIRNHLAEEADRFSAGDFADPAKIHGRDMPGLADLQAGATRIRIRYESLPAGARITFSTTDPALVTALERWGAAQVADHGRHAS